MVMELRRMQGSKSLQISLFRQLFFLLNKTHFSSSAKTLTHVDFLPSGDDPLYADVPKPRREKSERKPYPTPMKELIRRAKEEKELRKAQPCRVLEVPPDNGLLVPELVDVAHRVHQARASLLSGIARIARVIPVHRCRFCTEVHVGENGHGIRTCMGPKSGSRAGTHVWKKGRASDVVFFPKCFHLYDRVGRPRVLHDERFSIPRIPAVLELCIQAGVDIEKFPSKRRTKPVYSIEGRIVDFEDCDGNDEDLDPVMLESHCDSEENLYVREKEEKNLTELSIDTMESWFDMVSGVKQMMERYKVWTCGYCPEVQVGPKGHKVKVCKATKHQMRDGMHAWQEAILDDIIGPNFVWHVRDPGRSSLNNSLKRYYGKAPAVVELCVQGGAPVPDQYKSMMRLDVVPPEPDEVDLVA